MTPRAVLPKCASAELPSARISSLLDTESRLVGGELDAVDELDAGPRVAGQQQVAVEVDVVAEACELRSGGDPEAGFDHASEHHPEPERPRRMRHLDALADPAR